MGEHDARHVWGRPFALVDLSDPGTGMIAMMDADNADRPTQKDLDTIALARANDLDPQLAIYCWSVSEASASPNLIAYRNPHMIGRNADGTPYDFDNNDIDYCLVDTTGRSYGMLSDTCKISLMLVHKSTVATTSLLDPPNVSYRANQSGARIDGMPFSNSWPAVQSRKDFLAQSYLDAIRGKVSVSPAIVLMGDYSGGTILTSGESSIHPSRLKPDGQVLYAQHVAAHTSHVLGYMSVPSTLNMTNSTDGLTVTGIVDLPPGTTLTTIRRLRGETVAGPRPQQQEVMGFEIWRAGEGEVYNRTLTPTSVFPLFRPGEGVQH